jgi:exopolysaccharide production protein ExoY
MLQLRRERCLQMAPANRSDDRERELTLGLEMNAQFAVAQSEFSHATQADVDHQTVRAAFAPEPASFSNAVLWRAFDIVGSAAILIMVLPFLLVLAIVMYASDPGPLLFVHRRIGHRGKSFGCLKFRTMKVNGDEILREHLAGSHVARREWAETQKLRDDPRVTGFGLLVRKLSLDEFPQLINVLRGDMSLVGPRPIVEAEVHRYGRFFEHYCMVKPGLTGLWQISGRNDTSYRERVELDVEYVSRKSLTFDMMLIIKTVPAVLLARGSY